MHIERTVLSPLESPYAVAFFHTDRGLRAVAASEARGGCVCCGIDGSNLEHVWKDGGGVMGVRQVNRAGDFLAVQNFFPVFQSREARIVLCRRQSAGWACENVVDIPYLHRFDVFDIAGEQWLLAATLCRDKQFVDDWSSPGQVLAGRLADDFSSCGELRPVVPALTRNHGFFRMEKDGREVVLVSGAEGIFEIGVPAVPGGEWTSRRVFGDEVSDMIVADVDGDGEDELMTFEPFHGNLFRIYKPSARPGGGWNNVYGFPVANGHCFWAGDMFGRPALLVGYRSENAALLLMRKKDGPGPWSMEVTCLAENEAPNNIAVEVVEERILVLCSAGRPHEVSLYEIRR